jgi:release factor glutamine methyltransferase
VSSAGTVGEALSASRDALRAAGVPEASLDAELMLAAATGIDRAAIAARPERPVEAAAARRFGAMVRRRLQREPLAYITGSRGFRRIELQVDRRVLVPRPETELLVELALELEPATVLDVGTGSGAIALAVADELPGAAITATDVSADALAVARANAAALGVGGRVAFEHGSLPAAGGRWDLVLANLPYVPDAEWAGLQPEIRAHEPRLALTAGADGLDAIRALVAALAPGGPIKAAAVGLEVGIGQGEKVAQLLTAAGYPAVEVRPDLAGIGRAVVARQAPGEGGR